MVVEKEWSKAVVWMDYFNICNKFDFEEVSLFLYFTHFYTFDLNLI